MKTISIFPLIPKRLAGRRAEERPEAERLAGIVARATARLREQEAVLEAKYGPNILDEWDELCREFNSRKSRTAV